jgi:hypothetical protein
LDDIRAQQLAIKPAVLPAIAGIGHSIAEAA